MDRAGRSAILFAGYRDKTGSVRMRQRDEWTAERIRRCASIAATLTWAVGPTLSADPVQWAGNGHYYEVRQVEGGESHFDEAARSARQSELFGAVHGGHLVTITSAEEQAFVEFLVQAHFANVPIAERPAEFWLGGVQRSDADSADSGWQWPRAFGREDWSYDHWGDGEPNDFQGQDEDVLSMWGWRNGATFGTWNDSIRDRASSDGWYIVEWSVSIWNAPSGGDFFDPTHWTGEAVPELNDTALFDSSSASGELIVSENSPADLRWGFDQLIFLDTRSRLDLAGLTLFVWDMEFRNSEVSIANADLSPFGSFRVFPDARVELTNIYFHRTAISFQLGGFVDLIDSGFSTDLGISITGTTRLQSGGILGVSVGIVGPPGQTAALHADDSYVGAFGATIGIGHVPQDGSARSGGAVELTNGASFVGDAGIEVDHGRVVVDRSSFSDAASGFGIRFAGGGGDVDVVLRNSGSIWAADPVDLLHGSFVTGSGTLGGFPTFLSCIISPGEEPGASIGEIEIPVAVFGGGSELRVDVFADGRPGIDFDLVRLANAGLGGSLKVRLRDGFRPTVGTQIEFVVPELTTDGPWDADFTGRFSSVEFSPESSGLFLDYRCDGVPLLYAPPIASSGQSVSIELAASDEDALVRVPNPSRQPFMIRLVDTDPSNENYLLASWDMIPDSPGGCSDYWAATTSANQELRIPAVCSQDTLILAVRSTSSRTLPSQAHVEVIESPLVVESVAPSFIEPTDSFVVSVEGFGFVEGLTRFALVSDDSEPAVVAEGVVERIDQNAEAIVRFEGTSLEASSYHLVVQHGGALDASCSGDVPCETLRGAIEITGQGTPPRLAASLSTDRIRANAFHELDVLLENSGDGRARSPLLRVSLRDADLDPDSSEAGTGDLSSRSGDAGGALHFLPWAPRSLVGELASRAPVRVPTTIRAETNQIVRVDAFAPDATVFDWDGVEAAPPPFDVSQATWTQVVTNLRARLGDTMEEVLVELTTIADGIAHHRGSIGHVEAWEPLEVALHEAFGFSATTLELRVTDSSGGCAVGEIERLTGEIEFWVEDDEYERSFAPLRSPGTVSLEWLEPGETYLLWCNRIFFEATSLGRVTEDGAIEMTVPFGNAAVPVDVQGRRRTNDRVGQRPRRWGRHRFGREVLGVPSASGVHTQEVARVVLDTLVPAAPPLLESAVSIVGSVDPNEKHSDPEDGSVVAYGQEIVYTIYFENTCPPDDPNCSRDLLVPARVVEIVDDLDPEMFDLTSFRPHSFGFNGRVIRFVPSVSSVPTEFESVPTVGRDVSNERVLLPNICRELERDPNRSDELDEHEEELRVDLDFREEGDGETRPAGFTFTLSTISCAGSALPDNGDTVDKGFLPVSDPDDPSSTRGEGFFRFAIVPNPELPPDEQTSNKARITFDDNPPIDACRPQFVEEGGECPVRHTVVEGTHFFRRGDANLDGTVDISDAISALTYLFAEPDEFRRVRVRP